MGITSDTTFLIPTKGCGAKEAGRAIALVAGVAGSAGLGYSPGVQPQGTALGAARVGQLCRAG